MREEREDGSPSCIDERMTSSRETIATDSVHSSSLLVVVYGEGPSCSLIFLAGEV